MAITDHLRRRIAELEAENLHLRQRAAFVALQLRTCLETARDAIAQLECTSMTPSPAERVQPAS